jgi:hypothetical protein
MGTICRLKAISFCFCFCSCSCSCFYSKFSSCSSSCPSQSVCRPSPSPCPHCHIRFILEQVSVFYRFSLSKSFEHIDGMPPESIHPLPWVMAWVLIAFCLLFFLYWTFAWGVSNGSENLFEWGQGYGERRSLAIRMSFVFYLSHHFRLYVIEELAIDFTAQNYLFRASDFASRSESDTSVAYPHYPW